MEWWFVTITSKGGYATVVYREVPTVSIDLVATGVRLRCSGVSGRSYNIERAPAVTGPWSPINSSPINTQTASASGLFEYLDTNSRQKPPSIARASHEPVCGDPRTRTLVRWRRYEPNVRRAVKRGTCDTHMLRTPCTEELSSAMYKWCWATIISRPPCFISMQRREECSAR